MRKIIFLLMILLTLSLSGCKPNYNVAEYKEEFLEYEDALIIDEGYDYLHFKLYEVNYTKDKTYIYELTIGTEISEIRFYCGAPQEYKKAIESIKINSSDYQEGFVGTLECQETVHVSLVMFAEAELSVGEIEKE